ncbi:DUF952 domain-containing protein [Nocardia farcinica]|uniref:DUF952 domain-containing protein n=1 Tax=Nocardia farcinica TaxID=37329 RepID=UPI001893CEFE|nr:DUF952 domain-containing protein [Nocardia farcinica]MBF6382866.1 DUF952 domain-containing protein [Nocardia farcinica]
MRYDTHTLVHLCSSAEWTRARAADEYRPASLDEIGFVHLSAPAQAHLPANRLFAGREDLVVLHIDTRRVTAPIRWEPGLPDDPAGMLFPHLYGPLPVAAVTAVRQLRPAADGTFAPLDGAD